MMMAMTLITWLRWRQQVRGSHWKSPRSYIFSPNMLTQTLQSPHARPRGSSRRSARRRVAGSGGQPSKARRSTTTVRARAAAPLSRAAQTGCCVTSTAGWTAAAPRSRWTTATAPCGLHVPPARRAALIRTDARRPRVPRNQLAAVCARHGLSDRHQRGLARACMRGAHHTQPLSRPRYIHEYKITTSSLYAAASIGFTSQVCIRRAPRSLTRSRRSASTWMVCARAPCRASWPTTLTGAHPTLARCGAAHANLR